jgi:DNA repair exonuclease SbcCD ATPase subunit
MMQDLTDARKSLREAEAAGQEIRRLEAESLAAKRALENAAQRLHGHREVVRRIDDNRRLEAELARRIPEHLSRVQEARGALARSDEQLAAAAAETKALAPKEQQLERLAGALVGATRKDELARRLKALEDTAQTLTAIDAELSQIRITPKTVEGLDESDRQIAALDAQLSAAAATLAVEVKAAGTGQVCIGALPVKGNHAAPVLAPTKVIVGDMAIVTVTPAVLPRQDRRQALDAARVALLKSAGVTSAVEAHAFLARRRDLEASRRGLLAELKTLKAGDDPTAAAAETKSALAEIEAAIAAALTATGREALPTQAVIDTERLEFGQKRETLDAKRANLDATREEQQAGVETAVALWSGIEARLEMIRKSIAEDLALCPDADRANREVAMVSEVADCEAAQQTKATTLAAVQQTAPDVAEVERRELRCQRLEQVLDNHNAELMQLERDIGRLTGQIQAAGGDGVGEAHAAAKEQRVLAERDCARIQERIATLQLLRDTVGDCLAEGRERYYEPVRRHLRPYLNDLFPGAELELGDGFTITGMKRTRSESFKRLSGGTQEQIAVLVRLAMGTMLAERGGNVPIILDDALVYCDDDRINLMFDALSRAGKHQQIIVLTCRLRSFASLGGHTLRVQTDGDSCSGAPRQR